MRAQRDDRSCTQRMYAGVSVYPKACDEIIQLFPTLAFFVESNELVKQQSQPSRIHKFVNVRSVCLGEAMPADVREWV